MHGHPYGLVLSIRRYRPLPQREVAQLRRAVHEVIQVGCGEGHRVVGGKQLRGNLPLGPLRRRKRYADFTIAETSCPHERRGDVEVGVGGIDLRVRSVRPVGKQGIRDPDGRIVNRHVPLIGIGSLYHEGMPLTVCCANRIDVLGELVERVSPRRRATHPQLEGYRWQRGERDCNLGFVVHDVGKRNLIFDLCTQTVARAQCEYGQGDR